MEITRTGIIDYEMPEFVRTIWVSVKAKQEWESRFRDISNLFHRIELEAVRIGEKRVTLQSCPPEGLDELTRNLLGQGLVVVPISKVPRYQSYVNKGRNLEENEVWQYRIMIGHTDYVHKVMRAQRSNDSILEGILLGYPACCVDFFNKYWVQDGWRDTSYPMSGGYSDIYRWNYASNILLRWLGLRMVSHLPCSFNCQGTRTIGETYYHIGCELGYSREMNFLVEILSWPIEWSGLHGIGAVTTPVCKIIFNTDMLASKKVVRLYSQQLPVSAGNGMVFPFNVVHSEPIDNGFANLTSQDQAHKLIIDILRQRNPKSVIDLGCGNSMLLDKIAKTFGASTFGIDSNTTLKPNQVANIFDVDDFSQNFDIALISINRINDNPMGWLRLAKIIAERCSFLVIYSYEGQKEFPSVDNFKVVGGMAMADSSYVVDLYAKTSTVHS